MSYDPNNDYNSQPVDDSQPQQDTIGWDLSDQPPAQVQAPPPSPTDWNSYDPNQYYQQPQAWDNFDPGQYYSQAQPQQDYQPDQAYQDQGQQQDYPDLNYIATHALDNWSQSRTSLGGAGSGLLNAVSQPWEAPAPDNQDWLGSAWDFTNRAAASFSAGLGTAVSGYGSGVDAAANSNIPGVAQVGQGLRSAYEQTAEPLMNAIPSVIGAESKAVDFNNSWNPLDWQYNAQSFRNDYAANDPISVYNQTYQSLIAQGSTPEEAQLKAQREAEKMLNPFNRAERGGQQQFATFAPAVQLAEGFLDPLGNRVGNFALGGHVPESFLTRELPGGITVPRTGLVSDTARAAGNIMQYVAPLSVTKKVLGAAASVTHLDDLGNVISKKLESPQGKQANFVRTGGDIGQAVQEIVDKSKDTDKPLQAGNVYDEMLNNPDSPLYQQFGSKLDPDTAELMRQGIDQWKESQESPPSKNPLVSDAKLGEDQQKLGQALGGRAVLDPAQKAEIDAVVNKPPGASPVVEDKAWNEFSPQKSPEAQKALDDAYQARKAARPDSYKAVKMPSAIGEVSDFQHAFEQMNGLRVKALKLAGPVGKPSIVPTRNLEQWGPVGAVLGGVGKLTLPWMSRLYLNSPARVWKDAIGNYGKAVFEGYKVLGYKKTTAQYEKVFGTDKTPAMAGNITHDARPGGEKGKSQNKGLRAAANVGAWTLNPKGEAGSLLTRLISRGKFENLNALTEHLETVHKEHLYRQARLTAYYKRVSDFEKSGELKKGMASQLRGSHVTPELAASFIKGIQPEGSDFGAAMRGEYHPTNFSPEALEFAKPVFEGVGPDQETLAPFVNAIKGGLDDLPRLLDEHNQAQTAKLAAARKAYAKARDTSKPLPSPNDREFATATMADITPGHPVFEKMEAQVNQALDNLHTPAVLAERADPNIIAARKDLVTTALAYMNRNKNLTGFKRVLAREIDRSEGLYKTQYKTNLYDQLNQTREQAAVKQQHARPAGAKVQASPPTPLKPIEQESRSVPNYPISKLHVDPERFQYKHASGEGGIVGSLKGVDKFNKDFAGRLQVWKDPKDGKVYVVNGHNRLDLAKRTGQKNFDVIFLDAKTATEARATGALTNIAEGQGTPLDAAKYFRDSGQGIDALKAQGLRLDGKTANDGLALANLAPALFDKVARYEYPLDRAITIGKKIQDHTLQIELNRLIDEGERGGKKLTDNQVSQLAEQVAGLQPNIERQRNLFGNEEIKSFNLVEKAKLADQIASKIGDERREFGAVAKNKAGLERGGNVINREQSGAIADKAREAADLFNIKKVQVGKISDILNEYATRIKTEKPKGRALSQLQDEAYEKVREELNQTFTKRETGEEAAPQQGSLFDNGEPTPGTAKTATQEPTQAASQVEAEKTPAQLAEEQKAQGQQDMFGQAQPEETAAPTKTATGQTPQDLDRLNFYADRIYGKGTPANILAPNQLQDLAKKMGRVDKATRNKYLNNMLDTDQHIREVTGNTFKLDPDTLHPVRVSDGQFLQELLGKEPPETVGAKLPQPPKEIPAKMEDVVKAVQDMYGEDAYKDFAAMTPADRDLAYSEIAKMMGFPDPMNPATAQEELDHNHGQAYAYMEALKQDMQERKATTTKQDSEANKAAKAQRDATDQTNTDAEAEQKKAAALMAAYRARLSFESSQAAFKTVADIHFDYTQKNLVDQALSGIIPFNFWARQNFAYVIRHMAAHPMHYAALLNFYKQLEAQNTAQGVPDFAKNDIFLWQNADGSKVMWNFDSINPFNPLGNSDSFMNTVSTADPSTDGKTANKSALAFLFGADRKNAAGKVTGRDLGLVSTFLKPNPYIDWATKTGKVNQIYKALGWTTDGFGSPDPSEGGLQKQTTGLAPSRTLIKDIGALTGATKMLRDAGIIKSDLDIEAPLNELLFGKNAGKPQTAIYQELTSMAEKGTISAEQAKKAIAAYKQGNWTPEALAALDRVEAGGVGQQALSALGFSNTILNTPREQEVSQLQKGYAAVKNDKGHYETVTDPKTGKDVQKFVPGKLTAWEQQHPGYGVNVASQETPEKITQSLADDKTRAATDQLYQNRKNMSLRDYNAAMDKLKQSNPTYFQTQEINKGMKAVGLKSLLPGETRPSLNKIVSDYKAANAPGYNDRKYAEDLDQYHRTTGSTFTDLQAQVKSLMDSGDKKGAYALENSKAYLDAKSKQDAFLKLNPEFASRYNDYLISKGYKGLPTEADKASKDAASGYASIGSGRYAQLNQQYQDLKNQGRTKEANALFASPEYQRLKAAREQYLLDHPEFATQYQAANEAKYGPKPPAKTFVPYAKGGSSGGKGGSSSSSYRPAARSTGGSGTKTSISKTYSKPIATKGKAGYNSYGKQNKGATPTKSNIPGLAAIEAALAGSGRGGKSLPTPRVAATHHSSGGHKSGGGKSRGGSSRAPRASGAGRSQSGGGGGGGSSHISASRVHLPNPAVAPSPIGPHLITPGFTAPYGSAGQGYASGGGGSTTRRGKRVNIKY